MFPPSVDDSADPPPLGHNATLDMAQGDVQQDAVREEAKDKEQQKAVHFESSEGSEKQGGVRCLLHSTRSSKHFYSSRSGSSKKCALRGDSGFHSR
jgi:hypothetical protein